VRAAASATGYVPNPTGRALRRQVADLWNVIVPDFNTFYTTVVSAIESVAIDNGIAVLLSNTREQVVRERHYVAAAAAQRVAGAIVAVASEHESDLTPLTDARTPTVLLDRRLAGFDGDMVLLDNEAAGRMAAEHLLAQGFEDLACLTGSSEVSATEGRLAGFAAALAAAGKPISDRRVVRSPLEADAARSAVSALLSSGHRPDAIYADTGALTLGAFQATQSLGALIGPTALVGHDDEVWARMVRPAVTVVHQPTAQMGAMAAQQLMRRIQGDSGPARIVLLQPSLVTRESSLKR
jgi:LacI family transcriptional regulator